MHDTDANQEYIKRVKKSSQWVFGIHQYIEGCRKCKQKLIYHLFNNICIKKGRKYQCIRRVGNYPNRYLEFTNILRDVGNQNENWLTICL